MNARFYNNERAGLSGICRLTTVTLAFVLGCFFNIGAALADKPDPCKGVGFSTSDNEELGCSVAAALHFGGSNLDSVRAYVGKYSGGKRGAKWLLRFNKNLNVLARDVFWASFAHIFSRKTIMDWTDEEFIGELAVAPTRVDIMHQTRRTNLKVRALIRASKEVAAPPPPDKKAQPAATPPAPPKTVP